MDITEVAKRSGTSAAALRYYEQRGLVSSIGRHGLRRVFDRSVLDRLALIALGRAAGFSLEEISRMLPAQRTPHIDRKILAAKADEFDERIRCLSAIRDSLRHAVKCSASSHMECPTFRRLLRVAVAGNRIARRKSVLAALKSRR
jgi:DNA-binding transcriptional MerR regulator